MVDAVVIGGGGFIGRYLVRLLCARGYRVRIVSRSAEPGSADGVETMRGSVSDPQQMRAAVAGARDVYHLGAAMADTWSGFERDYVQSSRQLVEICQQAGVRRLLYTSSIAALYLGDAGPVTDETPCDPHPEQRGLYSRAKNAAEAVFNQAHAKDHFPVVIVRPALVVGAGGTLTHAGLGYWASDLCCIGWSMGDIPLPFVLAPDVAAGMLAAMETPAAEGRSFNLTGDVRPTAREFIAELTRRARRRYQFYPRSLAQLMAVDIAKWMVKVAARKPENPFPGTRDLKSRALRAPIDCSGAKTLLGWKPVADPAEFYARAIDANLRPIPEGDLRLVEQPL